MPAAPPLLAVRSLRFERQGEPVFGPLDFALATGQALLVRGRNGAGKTTLLRILAGLLEPTAGSVQVHGAAVDPAHPARHCAYLGHLPGHKAELSVSQNIAYAAALQGQPAEQAESLLEAVGLSGYEDTPCRKLSAGQNKRLALARLRLARAPLWLLDEPYANLDPAGIVLVNAMVAAQMAGGGAALISTHGAYATPEVPMETLWLGSPEA